MDLLQLDHSSLLLAVTIEYKDIISGENGEGFNSLHYLHYLIGHMNHDRIQANIDDQVPEFITGICSR